MKPLSSPTFPSARRKPIDIYAQARNNHHTSFAGNGTGVLYIVFYPMPLPLPTANRTYRLRFLPLFGFLGEAPLFLQDFFQGDQAIFYQVYEGGNFF